MSVFEYELVGRVVSNQRRCSCQLGGEWKEKVPGELR